MSQPVLYNKQPINQQNAKKCANTAVLQYLCPISIILTISICDAVKFCVRAGDARQHGKFQQNAKKCASINLCLFVRLFVCYLY